ncbi:MAG: NUDIX hydrolase [Methylomonas sp.]|nr:MAG: NUDIX hydrolase [Methylobacter sp.]PPD37057.1 MAG: NUDIX hydrolase [Methylomonas sp.]
MVWKPHVTVAAIIEHGGQFLLVEEDIDGQPQFNQPAGHLEDNEDLLCAVRREVFEETGWQFEPEYLVAIQLWRKQPDGPSFVRFCFGGHCHSFDASHTLDTGIIATHWLTAADIKAQQLVLRSPLVLISIEQFLQDQRHPLSLLQAYLEPIT